MRKFGLAAIVAASACASVPASAVVQWNSGPGANGHFYEFVAAPVASWDVARAAALGSMHNGQNGYLATITSAEENAFIASISGSLGWLGGTDTGTEGVWKWADGPEVDVTFWTGGPGGSTTTYANWVGGEPNDDPPGEDWLHFNFIGAGNWNDAKLLDTNNGYFVEYGGTANGGIPEPATWAMMIGGLGLVGGAMRRRARMASATA